MLKPNSAKPGNLEVWWVDTSTAGATLDQFAQATDLLTAQDIDGRSNESRWARVVLRFALSRYGDKELAFCPIEAAAAGQPFLLNRNGPTFSISHSADHIAVALATDGPIGIDIECNRPIKMSTKRQLQIAAQARAHGLDVSINAGATDTGIEFLTLWTKLEALAKARGDGIGAVLTELKAQPSEAARNLFSKVGATDVRVQPLSLANELVGALVAANDKGAYDVHELPKNLSALMTQFETNCAR